MEKLDRDRIERAARLYASNQEAGQALGVSSRSFSRACRRYGIENAVRQTALVVGDREAANGQVALRQRTGASPEPQDLDAVVAMIASQAASRALD